MTAAVRQLTKQTLYLQAVRERLAAEELDLGPVDKEILELKMGMKNVVGQHSLSRPHPHAELEFCPGHKRREKEALPLRILCIDVSQAFPFFSLYMHGLSYREGCVHTYKRRSKGGGIKGLVPALVVQRLEQARNSNMLNSNTTRVLVSV
jgi:hypothetical protein